MREMDQIRLLISYNDQLVEDPNVGEQVVGRRTKVVAVSRNSSYKGLVHIVNSIVRHNLDKYDVELQAITMGPKTTCRIDILDDNNVQFLLMEDNMMPQVCVTLVERRCAAANKDDQSMPNVEQSYGAANEMGQIRLLISYNGRWVKDPNMGKQYVAERAIDVVVSRSLSYKGLVQIINYIFRHNHDIYDVELQAIIMGPETTCRIDILNDNNVQFLLMEGNVMPQVCVTLVERRCAATNKDDQLMPNVEHSHGATNEMGQTRLLISYNGRWVEDPNMGEQYVAERAIGVVVSRSLSYKGLVQIINYIFRHNLNIYDIELQAITMGPETICRIDILDDNDVQFLLMEGNMMPQVYVTLVEHRCTAATNAEEANEIDQTRLLISYNGRWVEDSNMGEQYVDQRAIGMVVSRSLSYEGLMQLIISIVRHNRDIYDVKLQAITMDPERTCRIDILNDNDVQFLLMESNAMPHVYVTLVECRCVVAISYNGRWVEDPNMGERYVDQRDIRVVVSRSLSYEGLVQIINSIVRYNRDIYDVKLQAIIMGPDMTYRIDILYDNHVQFLLKEVNVIPHVYVTLVQRWCAAATNAEEANKNRMGFERTRKLYKAYLDKDWETIKEDLSNDQDDCLTLSWPITAMEGNNIVQLAVYSRSKEPLHQILSSQLIQHDDLSIWAGNAQGNTVMHEAAISGNLEAVYLLVLRYEELIEDKNDFGETPLFRAAAFGNTKIVKFLADRELDTTVSGDGIIALKLKDIHRKREDGTTILHAAIQGRNFGTTLELLKWDEELAEEEDKNGINCLQLLADTPSAFKSGYKMGIGKKLFHLILPVGCTNNDDADNLEKEDEDIRGTNSILLQASYRIYLSIWRIIIQGCPGVRKIWKEKRQHKFACELAGILVERDKSWEKSMMQFILGLTPIDQIKEDEEKPGTPLFAAIKRGNVEAVKMILKEHPEAIEPINDKNQNILHMAVMYRQKDIFDLVKTKEIAMMRLTRQIDVNGYTILHNAADTKYYEGGTRSGPAYQLQEELEWFSSVKEIMPSYCTILLDKNKKIAYEIFKEKHEDQHKEAQKWIKETSQSCSAVAVLVATVVFAAAFTVPGGTNDNNGQPILLYSPFFLFFTITDIISLSCSLTAVVMFLSVITSPFELEHFHISLPRRLTFGFALLFMSVATTMLAFTSTIFLIIKLDERRRWTMTLICSAALFPVSVLALTHFPLFVSFINAWKNLFSFPCSLLLLSLKFLRNKVHQYRLSNKEKGK